jgi:hypothetical protein
MLATVYMFLQQSAFSYIYSDSNTIVGQTRAYIIRVCHV